MKIVITYRHKGDETYIALMRLAFQSAKKWGYQTVLVHDTPIDVDADIKIQNAERVPLMDWVLMSQRAFINSAHFDCDSVLFSPDAIINRPLQPVFEKNFDIAVTVRDNPEYPVNNGVIFIKPKNKDRLGLFFLHCVQRCAAYNRSVRDWYGDQLALHEELAENNDCPLGLVAKRLECEMYNASPEFFEAYITHYKGKRKDQMLAAHE